MVSDEKMSWEELLEEYFLIKILSRTLSIVTARLSVCLMSLWEGIPGPEM